MHYNFHHSNSQYNNPFFLTYGVKILLFINIFAFLFTFLYHDKYIIFQLFGLVPNFIFNKLFIWQLFTYLFIHGSFFHILFNMFVLWIFGKDLEHDWGTSEFLFYFFVCGTLSGFITSIISINSLIPIVGSSGAIYGLLVAYGYKYPNKIVLLYGLLPIKVKYLVIILGFISFFSSVSTVYSTVSHLTHICGMLVGIIYLFLNFKLKYIHILYKKIQLYFIKQYLNKKYYAKQKNNLNVDKILDKIVHKGWHNLNEKEKKIISNINKDQINKYPN